MRALRYELQGSAGRPTMRMLVPGGWRAVTVDDEGLAELRGQLRTQVRRAGRPDVDAFLSSSLVKWMTELRERGGRFAVLPLDPPEGTAFPMSFTVSIVDDEPGRTIEAWVTAKIREGDTEFLDDRRSVLAWRTSAPGEGQMTGTISDQYFYVVPVPGSQRKSAAMLHGTHLLDAAADSDDPRREAARVLFDSMALSLDWPPA
ncbi:hypothetical protein [Microbacterium sp. CPCC 204701]|uniref:hypothetical protein n=1 Tax=Microbacterium sp. CPCC 204701 TaxID=2493084 RepID=UPI000FD925D4|nr:hypothetical protein [Microbacterium sp. CPCC 204701]